MKMRREELDGHGPIEFFVEAGIHRTGCTGSQQGAHAVSTNLHSHLREEMRRLRRGHRGRGRRVADHAGASLEDGDGLADYKRVRLGSENEVAPVSERLALGADNQLPNLAPADVFSYLGTGVAAHSGVFDRHGPKYRCKKRRSLQVVSKAALEASN